MRDRIVLAFRVTVVVALASMATLLSLPSPMRSAAWTPPRAPNLEGPFSRNEALLAGERLAGGQIVAPESIAVDAEGRLYTGTIDGKIVRVIPGSKPAHASVEVFADTGGRPLGMAVGTNGTLYVADVMKGLLAIDRAGNIDVLTREAEGTPLVFLNSIAPSADGRSLYVTDSSAKWAYGDQVNDVLEAIPSGRLLRFDLQTRTSAVLLRGLAFPNGLALSDDESHLLVAESARNRVTRVWLTGDKRNLFEPFLENLPGFPDNISKTERGTYWVALYTVRKPLLDVIHPYPFVKDCIAALPHAMRPRPISYGLVFEVDEDGHVLRSLHDPSGARFRDLTHALELDSALYLGTLSGTGLGRVRLDR